MRPTLGVWPVLDMMMAYGPSSFRRHIQGQSTMLQSASMPSCFSSTPKMTYCVLLISIRYVGPHVSVRPPCFSSRHHLHSAPHDELMQNGTASFWESSSIAIFTCVPVCGNRGLQGIVWGTNTPQTIRDERLVNRFDYDGEYGTVLNRFLMQARARAPLNTPPPLARQVRPVHVKAAMLCERRNLTNAGPRLATLARPHAAFHLLFMERAVKHVPSFIYRILAAASSSPSLTLLAPEKTLRSSTRSPRLRGKRGDPCTPSGPSLTRPRVWHTPLRRT